PTSLLHAPTHPCAPHSFPTRRSSDLVVARDRRKQDLTLVEKFSRTIPERVLSSGESVCVVDTADDADARGPFSQSIADLLLRTIDRKSTRLNSSHVAISYAVFCLKKK